jgi:hypothetical protein
MVQDLGPPTAQGAAHGADLGHRVGGAGLDDMEEDRPRHLEVGGEVDRPDVLLGHPGSEHLEVGVTDAQPGEELVLGLLVI